MAVLGAGAGAGGSVTTATAVADGTISEGQAVFVRDDGTIIGDAANVAADSDKTGDHRARDDYAGYRWKWNRIFVDRAAGRAIWTGSQYGTYSAQDLKAKELTLNPSTGQIVVGSEPNNGQPTYSHFDTLTGGAYLLDMKWVASQKSWVYASRGAVGANAGFYDLKLGRLRFETDSQRAHTAHYTVNCGQAGEFQYTGTRYGNGGLVLDDDDNIYFFSSHGTGHTYGASSCQLHWVDWSANANITTSDFKNRVCPGESNSNNRVYECANMRGCFDSLNNQVIVATSHYDNVHLWAFTVTSSGGITFSHWLEEAWDGLNAGSSVGNFWDIESDGLGNLCVMGHDRQVYVAKNSGTAFTASSTPIPAPSLSNTGDGGMPLAMRYFPTYKQWLGVWCQGTTSAEDPTVVQQWRVVDGVAGATTTERIGKSSHKGNNLSGSAIWGPLGYNDTQERWGLRGALSDTGRFYGQGEGPDFYVWGGNVSGGWIFSNQLRISTGATGTYLGLANADIASGATGDVVAGGGEKDGFSNLIVGESYSATGGSALVKTADLTSDQAVGAIFVGTATAPTKILIGQDIIPPEKLAQPEPSVTSLLPGRFCWTYDNHDQCKFVCNALEYNYATAAPNPKTAVDVTGAGIWTCGLFVSNSAWTSARVIVTIDGVIVLDDTQDPGQYQGMAQCGALANATATYQYAQTFSEGHIVFNKSLKIEVEASHVGYYLYNYVLT